MKTYLKLIVLFISQCLLISCAQGPTKAFDATESLALKDTPIEAGSIIVDSRSDLETSLSKIQNSVVIRAQDFQIEKDDPFSLSRRLAVYGIEPASKVVIAGKIREGVGEDARLAWVLTTLGVKNVRIVPADKLARQQPNRQELPIANKPIWKPENLEEVQSHWISGKELKELKKAQKMYILDVRSEAEHKGQQHYTKARVKALQTKLPPGSRSPIALDGWVEWLDFYLANGDIDQTALSKLGALYLNKDTHITVVSNKGTRAAAAAFAMEKLGFTHVRVLAGGLQGAGL